MVKPIQRMYGKFEVAENDFTNLYYELTCNGRLNAYGYVHIQLAMIEKFAYCHVYLERFGPETAREIQKDWGALKHIMRTYGIKRAVGTKLDGIRVWSKFIKLLGFGEPEESIINNKPCMMAVLEL